MLRGRPAAEQRRERAVRRRRRVLAVHAADRAALRDLDRGLPRAVQRPRLGLSLLDPNSVRTLGKLSATRSRIDGRMEDRM